jgi:hypothetical protein
LNISELENVFSLELRDPDGLKRTSSASKRQSVTTVLDITRANNIGRCQVQDSEDYQLKWLYSIAIMLSRIKLSPSEIRRAILTVDDRALSLDDLKAIFRHLPTPEEVLYCRQE